MAEIDDQCVGVDERGHRRVDIHVVAVGRKHLVHTKITDVSRKAFEFRNPS
jgi:hypothetical protein